MIPASDRQFHATSDKPFSRNLIKLNLRLTPNRTPYQCKECGKAYSELSACHKHVRTHKVKPAVTASSLIAVDRASEAFAEDKETESKMEVIGEEEEGNHELLEVVTEDGQKLRLEPGEQFIPGEQYILVETTGEEDSATVVAGGGGGGESALSIAGAEQIIVPHGGGEVAEDGTEIAYEVVEVGEECAVTDVNAPEA